MWEQYTWLFALAFFVAFACAFGIGANDVANSFGTSVGAKAITIFQAVVIAAICEFLGAVLLGASVTDTIKNNVAKTSQFTSTPELLMFGMFCVMLTAAIWDNLACHLELPVSTTHTTVGAIVGMAIAIQGFDGVVWSARQPAFPYIRGMVPIFLSWLVSPCAAGIVVTILYGIVLRPFILRSHHSFARAFYVVPMLVGVTFFVIVYFIVQTGNKNRTWTPAVADSKAVWISIIPSVGMWLITQFLIMPLLKRNVLREEETEARQLEQAKIEAEGVKDGLSKTAIADIEAANSANPLGKASAWFQEKKANSKVLTALTENKLAKFLSYGSTYNVHNVVDETHADYDADTVKVWANAEVFDIKTEKLFRYLQVFSACVMSFAHGANDVANAMGPFAAVYNIWSNSSIPTRSRVPEWILVIGGAGIVAGLALFGYKIMRVIGVKAVKLSNVRGFSAELSTAIVVMVASRYGLPVSTTQTIMGAVLTIGLFEGVRGVNWKVFIKTFLGWIATLLFAAFICAGFSSLLMYAPQKTASLDLVSINRALGADTLAMLRQINGTQGANSVLLRQINGTVSAVFYLPPVVASETINTFNQVLRLYNTTFA